MGQIAIAVKHLIAAGIAGDALVRAIEDMEAAVIVQQAETKPARSRAAERTAKWRAKKGSGGDGGVTRDARDGCDVTVTESVTVCDAECDLSPQTPLSETTKLNLTAGTREDREAVQRGLRNQSKAILEAVKTHVNGSADWTQPNMHRVDTFIQLMAPMKGEPCDFDLDIAPAIEAAAARLHADGGKLTSWNYVRPIAIQNRDRRLAGLPDPEKPCESARQNHPGGNSNGSGSARNGPGHEYGGTGLFGAAARRRARHQNPDEVPSEPVDGRNARVA